MNRLGAAITVGLAAMDACWVAPWAVLFGLWTDPSHPRALLSGPSILALLLLAAFSTQAAGRRAAKSRVARFAVAGLGLVAALVAVRIDQYPDTSGVAWLGLTAGALANLLGEFSGPALAMALGLFVWWRGVRLGTLAWGFADAESAFRWGIGLLVTFALILALTTRQSLLPTLEAQTTPYIVAFFFVSLLTLALGRLESQRTRNRALVVNRQWLSVLIVVTGLVILLALLIGQILSFDLLLVASRPIFDLLGRLLMLAIYILVIPIAFVVEWLVYLLLGLLRGNGGQQQPQLLQPADINNQLQNLSTLDIPPEVLIVLKAAGATILLAAALLVVARAASRWRSSNAEADATEEQRESVWDAGRLGRLLLAWLRRLLRLGRRPSATVEAAGPDALDAVQAGRTLSIREVYRQLLRLGETAGAPRDAATTPLEHLRSLQLSLEPADDLASLTRAYISVRYADEQPSPAEAQLARDELDRLQPRTPPPDPATGS